jgi:hypothetical protein
MGQWEVISAVAASISAIVSVVGLPFLAIQIRSSNQIAKAQLINELERDISLHAGLYTCLVKGGSLCDKKAINEDERNALLQYISFFERVDLVVNTKIIDIKTVNSLFGGRFFMLMENPNTIELINSDEISPYTKSIRERYIKWSKYRKEYKQLYDDNLKWLKDHKKSYLRKLSGSSRN